VEEENTNKRDEKYEKEKKRDILLSFWRKVQLYLGVKL
jgi:hypothetical protein